MEKHWFVSGCIHVLITVQYHRLHCCVFTALSCLTRMHPSSYTVSESIHSRPHFNAVLLSAGTNLSAVKIAIHSFILRYLVRMPHLSGTGPTYVRQTRKNGTFTPQHHHYGQNTGNSTVSTHSTAGAQLAVAPPHEQYNHAAWHVRQGNCARFKISHQSSLTATNVAKDVAVFTAFYL